MALWQGLWVGQAWGARVLDRTPPLSLVLLTSGWEAGLSGDQWDGRLARGTSWPGL